jgi:hypothetical protein
MPKLSVAKRAKSYKEPTEVWKKSIPKRNKQKNAF